MARSPIIYVAFALAAALSIAAQAASDGVSADFVACAKKVHGATFPLLHCYSEEMKAQDAALAAAYERARRSTDNTTTKKFLTRSQAAWENYRDAWCEATVSRSGSLARVKLFECRLSETKRRTEALANLSATR